MQLTRRSAVAAIGTLLAGCATEESDPGGSGDPNAVENFEPPSDSGPFPRHGVLEDGVTEIGTRSQFLEILEGNGTTVRDWSHESGTLMGLHIEIGGEPSGIGDVSSELSLISKAWWGWMMFDGELRPASEWSPDDMDGNGDERYPANLIEVNMYTEGSEERVGWVSVREEAIVGYLNGELSTEEYRSDVTEGAALPA